MYKHRHSNGLIPEQNSNSVIKLNVSIIIMKMRLALGFKPYAILCIPNLFSVITVGPLSGHGRVRKMTEETDWRAKRTSLVVCVSET